jgi:hypothetical protein
VCHVCGKPGLAGVLFLTCCMILTKDAIRCGSCGCLNLISQFNRTGCRARVTLPMCAPADGDMGARPGLGSTVLTASQASDLERFYMRVQAMRDRQALLRSSLPASVHSGCLLEGVLDSSDMQGALLAPGPASARVLALHTSASPFALPESALALDPASPSTVQGAASVRLTVGDSGERVPPAAAGSTRAGRRNGSLEKSSSLPAAGPTTTSPPACNEPSVVVAAALHGGGIGALAGAPAAHGGAETEAAPACATSGRESGPALAFSTPIVVSRPGRGARSPSSTADAGSNGIGLAVVAHGGVARGTASGTVLVVAAAPVALPLPTRVASDLGAGASCVVSGGGRGRSRPGQGYRQRKRRRAAAAAASAAEVAAAAIAATSIMPRSLALPSGCASPLYPPGIPLRSGGARAAVGLTRGQRDCSPVRERAPEAIRPMAVAVSGINDGGACGGIACPAGAHASAPSSAGAGTACHTIAYVAALFLAVSATSEAAAWAADETAAVAASRPSSAMDGASTDAVELLSGHRSPRAPGTAPSMTQTCASANLLWPERNVATRRTL